MKQFETNQAMARHHGGIGRAYCWRPEPTANREPVDHACLSRRPAPQRYRQYHAASARARLARPRLLRHSLKASSMARFPKWQDSERRLLGHAWGKIPVEEIAQ